MNSKLLVAVPIIFYLMEDEKLQRLHDSLAKLAPKSKVGGLGFQSGIKPLGHTDPTLPKNGVWLKLFCVESVCVYFYYSF